MKRLNMCLILLFTIGYLLITEVTLHKYNLNMMNQIEAKTRTDLKDKANTLQSEIKQDFSLIHGMEAFTKNDFFEDEKDDQVQKFLSRIYDKSNKRVLSLVIAPNGMYKFVHPLKGNENLIDYNINNQAEPSVQNDLVRAKSSKKIIISKPYNLLQNQQGIVARKAIFNEDQFWGYISVALSLSEVLNQAGIPERNDGMQIALRFSGEKAFYGQDDLFKNSQSVHQSIALLDGQWEIAAIPSPNELIGLKKEIILFRCLGYLVGILTLLILCILLTQKDMLNKLVSTRTKELYHAQLELSEVIEEMKASETELRYQNKLLNSYTNALMDSEKKLSHLAYFDQLTGIANRMHFTEVLEKCLEEVTTCGAIIYFDLDNFKMVNDTYGHSTGDILLKSVAQRIVDAQLPITAFARLGGDEFGIIVNEIDLKGARKLANEILQLFQTPFQLPEKLHYINTSIGISLFDEENRNFQTLLKHADITMYHAKRSGGNKIKVFHPGMNKDANQIIEISNDLRLALQREEFILHYQPQVDSRTGGITGVEALVRWNHPKKGFLPPAEFISVAEETGIIIDLGEWVLKRACLDMNSMIKHGLPLLPLAINLSARQFQDEALVCKMKKILKETEFPARLLEFEITESTAMKDDQLSILSEIQQLGINISIDDFGTHYSSLGYLKRFPVNKVKIDRSFIKGIQGDHKNLAILRAIIFVARDLGIDIIAEGVETEDEVQILSDYDCFNLQGFLYFRPLPFNELIDHLQS